jgi:hypothetical protein
MGLVEGAFEVGPEEELGAIEFAESMITPVDGLGDGSKGSCRPSGTEKT